TPADVQRRHAQPGAGFGLLEPGEQRREAGIGSVGRRRPGVEHLVEVAGGLDEGEGELLAVGVQGGGAAYLVLVPGGGAALEHLGAELLAVGGGESAAAARELLRPGGLQMQGVDQDEPGALRQRPLGDDLLDEFVRGVGDPAVDLATGLLPRSLIDEIRLEKAAAEPGGEVL